MLVVQLESPSPFTQGDQVLRTHQPCLSIAEAGDGVTVVAGTWLSPLAQMLAQEADVLVLAQVVWMDLVPLLAARRRRGQATIFEINDNFQAIQPFNLVAPYWDSPVTQGLLMQTAAASEGLQFSSPGLVERFGWLNPTQVLFPNQMREVGPWLANKWARPDPLVIGWAGSLGHRDDFRAIVAALRQVHDACPNVVVRVMAGDSLLAALDGWPGERLQRRSPGDYEAYRRYVAGLHIGIAPMQDTEFNACRSDVKFVEYAAGSAAAVVSDSLPYQAAVDHGRNGLVAAHFDDFVTHLVALARAPQRAADLARAAWREVATTRIQAQQAPARLAWLRRALAASGLPARPNDAAKRVAAAFRRLPCPAARPHRRFWQLQEDHAESRLVALLATATDEDAGQLMPALEAIAAASPQAYLPHLMVGRAHPDPRQARAHLARAEALLPWSCEVPYAAGVAALAAGERSDARIAFTRAAHRAPQLAIAHEALASLALDADQRAQAIGHLEDALAANPLYRPPAVALARLARATADRALATRLLAQKLPPAMVGAAEASARADLWAGQGAWREAAGELEAGLARHPATDALRHHLARAYLFQGRTAAARRLLSASTAATAAAATRQPGAGPCRAPMGS